MSDLISRKDLIDLISRDKTIDELELRTPLLSKTGENKESPRAMAMRVINGVPSEPLYGEWLEDKDNYGVVCSVCNHWQRDESNYCPNCGYDMRGEEDMLVNTNNEVTTNHVEFVSYNGRYPNLCRGVLTLKIDGKEVTFGYDYNNHKKCDYEDFWVSGGECGFSNGYSESYTYGGEWEIDVNSLPEEYKKYASEIDMVFNENVQHGCCGGCL